MAGESERVGAAAPGLGRVAGEAGAPELSASHERAGSAGGERDAMAEMVAQMRQLAEEHPEVAQRIAADLTAALGRAGMHFDGEKVTEHAAGAPEPAREGGAASEVVT